MDPTDIVKVPYDRSRLLIFVSFPTLLYCVILPLVRLFCINNKNNHPSNIKIKMTLISIINRIIEAIILTMVYFCTFIVAGASPFEKIIHTILAALYCATLSSSSSSSLLWIGGNDDDDSMQLKKIAPVRTLIDQILFRLFFLSPEDVILYEDNNTDDRKLSTKKRSLQQHQEEIMAGWILRSIIVILVPMQILLLYDRGWQIQRWPVPVIVGTTIGWVIGTFIGTVSILIRSTS